MPAHNEEDSIEDCLRSLAEQSYQNFRCVIVNDGSTDSTKVLVEKIISQYDNFTLKNLDKSHHQPGAKVVQTFNKGFQDENTEEVDIICKYDADLIFPKDYLERINEGFVKNPKIGMLSGLVYIKNDEGDWVFEDISSKDHVRGPIKSYRKDCFFDMKGLRAVLGWDNIDVMLAQKAGWEVATIKDLWVRHLRPTAYKYKKQKAQKLGEYFYNLGLDMPLAMISAGKSAIKTKEYSAFFITMHSYLKQNHERVLTQDEILYIKKWRWQSMFKKYTKS